jgi:hypothetical protein
MRSPPQKVESRVEKVADLLDCPQDYLDTSLEGKSWRVQR